MPGGSIRIRELEESDTEEFLRAKCRSFPGTRLANEQRRWDVEFRRNPVGQSPFPRGFVVECDGRLCGGMAYLPFRIAIDDEVVVGACGIDRFVDPELRGRGVGRELLRRWLAPEFCPFPFTMVAGDETLVPSRELGARVSGPGDWPLPWLLQLRGGAPVAAPSGRPAVARVAELPADVDALWESARNGSRLTVIRDRAYLEWRWSVVPFGGVVLLRASDGRATRGLAVLQDDARRDHVYLADLLCAQGDVDAFSALAVEAAAHAARLGREKLFFLAPPSAPAERLQAAGFARFDGDVPRTIARLNHRPRRADLGVEAWCPSIGDCDFTFDCSQP